MWTTWLSVQSISTALHSFIGLWCTHTISGFFHGFWRFIKNGSEDLFLWLTRLLEGKYFFNHKSSNLWLYLWHRTSFSYKIEFTKQCYYGLPKCYQFLSCRKTQFETQLSISFIDIGCQVTIPKLITCRDCKKTTTGPLHIVSTVIAGKNILVLSTFTLKFDI